MIFNLKRLLFSVCFACVGLSASAAVNLPEKVSASQGMEFWVTFTQNYDYDEGKISPELTLVAVSEDRCHIVLENETVGYSRRVTVSDGDTIHVPSDFFNIDEYGKVLDKGLHVVSEDGPISLYLANSEKASMDATLALPVDVCGNYYIVQMNTVRSEQGRYPYSPALFSIVAFEDNTIVEITPTLPTGDGHEANESYRVTLNKGQVYAVETTSESQGKDFSGSQVRVVNCKNVAVYMGNKNAIVPDPTPEGDSDITFEVAYPVTSWGTEFIVVPFDPDYCGDSTLVKCTASLDNTTISVDGKEVATINAYESYQFMISTSERPVSISTNAPASVYQYMTSSHYITQRELGAPSYHYVAPLEQASNRLLVTKFNETQIDLHYLTVVVPTSCTDSFTINDLYESRLSFKTVPGNDRYSYGTIELTNSYNMLAAPCGIVASVYGIGSDVSYAYSAGSDMRKLNYQTGVRGIVNDTICKGQYHMLGNNMLTETGVYYDDPILSSSGCDSITEIHLVVLEPDTTVIQDTAFVGSFYQKNGFFIQAVLEGDNRDKTITLTNSAGCDSIVTLKLYGLSLDCTNGTLLFREDFGGNNSTDTLFTAIPLKSGSTDLVHQPGYPVATTDSTYSSGRTGCYDIRKSGYERMDGAEHYSYWFWNFTDHTYEGDAEKGYFMQIDATSQPTSLYATTVEGLCGGSNLYFSFWAHPVFNSGLSIFMMSVKSPTGELLEQQEVAISTQIDEWQQYGMYFHVPNDVTSLVFEIYSEGENIGPDNDFALDDVEIRSCAPAVSVKGVPQDSLCTGESLTLGAVYDGEVRGETYAYRWYKNSEKTYSLDGWQQVAETSQLSFSPLTLDDAGYYRAVVLSDSTNDSYSNCNSASEIIPVFVKKCQEPCVPTDTTINVTMCEGQVYMTLSQKQYQEPGVYLDTLVTAAGCDSVVAINLTFAKADTTIIKDTAFAGYSYTKYDFKIAEVSSGDNREVVRTETNVAGCDSVVILQLFGLDLNCDNGTILFREDFGGNSVNDPIYGQPLPDGVISGVHFFSTHTWGDEIYNSYDIRKEAIKRLGNAQSATTHVYSGWYADFGDHTYEDDLTRGYFMQIDLDSKAATFYTRRIDGLCENTHLLFSVWGRPVNNRQDGGVRITIEDLQGNKLAEEEFSIHHSDNQWRRLEMPFTTPVGQSSVVYKVYSSASSDGGDFALDDIEVRLCVNQVEVAGAPTDTICVDDQQYVQLRASYDNTSGSLVEPVIYTWYKNSQAEYGAEGWEQLETQGKVLMINNPTVEDNGYYKVIASSNGSVAEFSLCNPASDIIPVMVKRCTAIDCEPSDTTFSATICEGEIYQSFNQKIYTEAGKYIDTLRSVGGCDSIVIMNLTVLKPDTVLVKDSVDFETETYYANGFRMTDLKVGLNTSVLQLKNSFGCDSIVNLELIRKECKPYEEFKEVRICKDELPYEYEGQELSVSKLYTWTYKKKSDDCDSIIKLNLIVEEPVLTRLSDAAFLGDSYHKNGFEIEALDSLGVIQYDLHLETAGGCDSTVVLYLSVSEKPETFEIPTAFTPHSNDGFNDDFMPGYEVYIYDRYGHMMVHSENGWDGTYKGEVATSGVYVYALKKKNGEMVKGTIEIVKSK